MARRKRGNLTAMLQRMRADEIPEQTTTHWRIVKFTVSAMQALITKLKDPRRAVASGAYTRLDYLQDEQWCVMMSDTPAELNDAVPFIQAAKGRVLVTGLGLGCVVRALAKKTSVTAVTVVEVSQELADLVWPKFKRPAKVELVIADARTWQPPAGTCFDSAWHDIWPTISDLNLIEMGELRAKYPTKGVTRCWAEAQCAGMVHMLSAMKNDLERLNRVTDLERLVQLVETGRE